MSWDSIQSKEAVESPYETAVRPVQNREVFSFHSRHLLRPGINEPHLWYVMRSTFTWYHGYNLNAYLTRFTCGDQPMRKSELYPPRLVFHEFHDPKRMEGLVTLGGTPTKNIDRFISTAEHHCCILATFIHFFSPYKSRQENLLCAFGQLGFPSGPFLILFLTGRI